MMEQIEAVLLLFEEFEMKSNEEDLLRLSQWYLREVGFCGA
jgi:hypothetical protein